MQPALRRASSDMSPSTTFSAVSQSAASVCRTALEDCTFKRMDSSLCNGAVSVV
jgi:hypothetical protein